MPDLPVPPEKLVEKAARLPDFTDEEIAALKAMADAWRGLESFGRLAGVAKTIVTWLGWALGAYLAFRAGAIDALKGALLK